MRILSRNVVGGLDWLHSDRMRKSSLFLLLAVTSCGEAGPPKPEFRELPGRDNYVMIVDPAVDVATYPALAKEHCGTAQQCTVLGWNDAAKAATALPMTDLEAASQVFSYSVNRISGHEQSLWNCKVYPRPAKGSECMATE